MSIKRGPFALAAAVAGFAGALGFHASGSTTSLAPKSSAASANPNAGPTTSPASSKGGTKGAPPTTTPRAHPATTPQRSSTKSATGSTYQYGYGQLAVRVTVTGAKITGLNVVGLQTAESYSQQIANQVIPMLRQEVLAAQSVRVHGISGATYTAEAYVSSAQSALNKLHFK